MFATLSLVVMIVSSVTILLLVEAPYGYAQSENLTQSQSENLTQVVIQTVSKIQQCSLTALAQRLGMALMDEATGDTNLCATVIYESPTRIVFTGDYIRGLTYNTGIWEVVDALEAKGLTLDTVELTGQGSEGNPHSYLKIMSR